MGTTEAPAQQAAATAFRPVTGPVEKEVAGGKRLWNYVDADGRTVAVWEADDAAMATAFVKEAQEKGLANATPLPGTIHAKEQQGSSGPWTSYSWRSKAGGRGGGFGAMDKATIAAQAYMATLQALAGDWTAQQAAVGGWTDADGNPVRLTDILEKARPWVAAYAAAVAADIKAIAGGL